MKGMKALQAAMFLACCAVASLSSDAFAGQLERGAMPAGFPAELALPFQAPIVFLTSREHRFGSDGSVELAAENFEFSRNNTSDAHKLMSHYLALFQRDGWSGSQTENDGVRRGEFSKDGINATVMLKPRGDGAVRFTMKVRVNSGR